VHVNFGGVKALDGASAEVQQGRITGIIGPNGAGKSTLFNVATGYLRSRAGAVELHGHDISRVQPHARVALGIGRTFQNLRLFGSLTVAQNLALACDGNGLSREAAVERVDRWIDFLGLGEYRIRVAGELDYGAQKTVALARVLCTGADVLLLDEPASGLDRGQVAALSDTVRGLVAEARISVCLVEHNMDLIRAVADDVYAMHEGRTIASGRADEVLADRDVVRVYLGG